MSEPIQQSDPLESRLERIHRLLMQITPLRDQASSLNRRIEQLESVVNAALKDIDAEIARHETQLETLRKLRKQLIAQKNTPTQAEGTQQVIDWTNNAGGSSEVVEEGQPNQPTGPSGGQRNLRLERKRSLIQHMDLVVDLITDSQALQQLNALVADDRRDLGDLLELIPWGDGSFWRARSEEWETAEEQLTWLDEWGSALAERLTYWQKLVTDLEKKLDSPLYQDLEPMGSNERKIRLEELRAVDQATLARLKKEINSVQAEIKTLQ